MFKTIRFDYNVVMANKECKQAVENLAEYLTGILEVTGYITDPTDPFIFAVMFEQKPNEESK